MIQAEFLELGGDVGLGLEVIVGFPLARNQVVAMLICEAWVPFCKDGCVGCGHWSSGSRSGLRCEGDGGLEFNWSTAMVVR